MKRLEIARLDMKLLFKEAGTTQGVYHLRGGETGYTYAIENDDGTFDLRYEHGWYCPYANDGLRLGAGVILKKDGTAEEVPGGCKRDIVRFEPMTWDEARDKYPGIAGGFPP